MDSLFWLIRGKFSPSGLESGRPDFFVIPFHSILVIPALNSNIKSAILTCSVQHNPISGIISERSVFYGTGN